MYGVDSWPKLLCATIIYSFGTNFVTFADKHEVLHIYQMGINQKVYFNDETIICKLATLHTLAAMLAFGQHLLASGKT